MPSKIRRLLGDRIKRESVTQMIRVNHAGEYGAVRIYEGQLKVLKRRPVSKLLSHMLEQEKTHLAKFDAEIVDRQVRPTALLPVWHICGLALGVGSALLGEKAAMACTVAVEEVIDQHYSRQIGILEEDKAEQKLKNTFEEFRREELEHRDSALHEGAENIPGYKLFSGAIKASSRIAIWLSTRL